MEMEKITTIKPLNQNKMTAVEWLQERINIGLTYEQEVLFEGLFEQAKEMEKEQIVEAYDKNKMGRVDYGEQYYNETFKSE